MPADDGEINLLCQLLVFGLLGGQPRDETFIVNDRVGDGGAVDQVEGLLEADLS